MKTPENLIPEGYYCYTNLGYSREMPPLMYTEPCPFWKRLKDRLNQEYGYCLYLQKGDFGEKFTLLWDQCKECGVND